MRIIVFYQEKKFIIVVSNDSTVDDLKSEIERVYSALFPDSFHESQSISELLTLTGCALYGGYTVSSVLVDNDIVTALPVAGSTSHDVITPPMSTNLSNSPFLHPFYGANPMGYHSSPMLNFTPGMMDQNSAMAVSPSKYYTPQGMPSINNGAGARMSLFQSPPVRTVGNQCPSPGRINEDTPQSDAYYNHSKESESVEKSGTESESPLCSEPKSSKHSHSLSTNASKQSFVDKSTNSSQQGNSAMIQKRKYKPVLKGKVNRITKTNRVKEPVCSSSSDVCTESPSTEPALGTSTQNSISGNGQPLGKESSPSQERKTNLLLSKPDNQRVSAKRMLSEDDEQNPAKKAKVATTSKIPAPAFEKNSVDDDSSSDWTSSDESVTKSPVKSNVKMKSASVKKSKSKSKRQSSSQNDESASLHDSKTQKLLDLSQTSGQVEKGLHKKSGFQIQDKGKKRSTPDITKSSSSSSDWTTDEESDPNETVLPTQKVQLKQSRKNEHRKSTVSSTQSVPGKNKKQKKNKDSSDGVQSSSGKESDENVVIDTESVNHDKSALLGSWSVTSLKTGVYTAQDGRRLKEKNQVPKKSLQDTEGMMLLISQPRREGTVVEDASDDSTNSDSTTLESQAVSEQKEESKKVTKDVNKDGLKTKSSAIEGEDVLAPNSLPSDEEVTGCVSQDALTVIQETQDVCDNSRCPSPEIPYLNQPQAHSTAQKPHQKIKERIKLCDEDKVSNKTSTRPSVPLLKKSSTNVKERKGDVQFARDYASDGDLIFCNSSSLRKSKKLKLNKKRSVDKQNQTENFDAIRVEVGSDSSLSASQKKKKVHPLKQLKEVIDAELSTEEATVSMSESQHLCNEDLKKNKKHKKSKKSKSTENQLQTEESLSELLSTTAQRGVVDETNSGLYDVQPSYATTDYETTDLNSDCNYVKTQSHRQTKKRKKKHKTKEPPSSPDHQSKVISETTNRASNTLEDSTDTQFSQTKSSKPTSVLKEDIHNESRGKVKHPQTASSSNSTSTPTNVPQSPRSDQKQSSEIFLKPSATPPRKSVKSTMLQLSPAASKNSNISLLDTQSQSKQKTTNTEGNSLLSVFSVTETEMSSDDDTTYEHSKHKGNKVQSKDEKKKPHKFNFLSSLGSHGKKVKPAGRVLPLSQSTLTSHTPSPSSRFSSQSAMRLFSLSHTSSRSGITASRKPKCTTNTPPKKLSHAEKIGPNMDDLLRETSGEQPSLSELLADGSLWDS